MKNHCMLATNYEDIKERIIFPMVGQPKLNGIRATWDGEILWSRQGKKWKDYTLPHVYDKLRAFSAEHPNTILDGELYDHGLPFQEIEARTAINRNVPHADCSRIDFHAFDIIEDGTTEERLIHLMKIYEPFVPCCRIVSLDHMNTTLARFIECGFEGMMLREISGVYTPGRIESLIKLKPWKYGRGMIIGYTKGEGKYSSMIGALTIQDEVSGVRFNASGGLSDQQRKDMAPRLRGDILLIRRVHYKYRDLSSKGRPLQPQIVKFL